MFQTTNQQQTTTINHDTLLNLIETPMKTEVDRDLEPLADSRTSTQRGNGTAEGSGLLLGDGHPALYSYIDWLWLILYIVYFM